MRRASFRSFGFQSLLRFGLLAALVAGVGCGFGLYNDSASPTVTGANDGVADAGPWWPWVCPNGSNPAAATTPQSYTVSGACGTGGTFALSVNGCLMQGNWDALGLTDVSTNISSSIPSAGGWEVAGTCPSGVSDGGGVLCTCDATAASSGVLTVTCDTGDAGVTACVTTLTPVKS